MEEVDVLQAIKDDDYRYGDLAVIRYDKARTDLFVDGYLGKIYSLCVDSKVLEKTFGGNPSSNYDSIVAYLAQRPVLLILGRWEGEKFVELGFAFNTVSMGTANTERSLIAGYSFFKKAWGSKDQQIVTMLGLAYFFKEFNLCAIIGNRFPDNILTAKFMARFGFKDCGEIPRFQLRGTKLVPMVVSALLREDFEKYVEGFLLEQYQAEAKSEVFEAEPVHAETEAAAPVEGNAAVDAKVARMAAGEIPVVFFPYSSTYVPAVPAGMDMKVVGQGQPGAGIYFFNAQQIDDEQVVSKYAEWTRSRPAAAPKRGPAVEVKWPKVEDVIPEAERAPKTTAPESRARRKKTSQVKEKKEIPAPRSVFVVEASYPDGAFIAKAEVERTADAVAAQIEAFSRKYPDCVCKVKEPKVEIDLDELPF